MLKECVKGLCQFLYPSGCLLCDGSVEKELGTYLCVGCLADLQFNQQSCRQCALPLTQLSDISLCAECLQSSPKYDSSLSALIYAQPLEWMIQQLKFNNRLAYAPLLSSLLLSYIQEQVIEKCAADAIIPMPLHPRRQRQRGFNQSSMLVRPVAEFLNIPLDTSSCKRLRDTPHQTGRTAKQRKQNIKGAFEFENKNNYQYVILFDDVVTTGSSVNELARVIKKSGVKKVDVWSLARAVK